MVKRNIDVGRPSFARPEINSLHVDAMDRTVLFQEYVRRPTVVRIESVALFEYHILQMHVRVWIKIYVLHTNAL